MNSPRRNCAMTSRSSHFMIWLLIFTFFLPAPFTGVGVVKAGTANKSDLDASAQGQDLLLAEVAGWNRHIHERLNSAERRAAIAEAARKEAEMAKAETAPAPAQAPAFSQPAAKKTQQAAASRKARHPEASENTLAANDAPDSRLRDSDSERPKSIGELLFNQAAGFFGVPGLTPQRDIYGNYDEGLGFHQDGTVRKAGGVAGASGPTDRGQRAQAYMRSGIQGQAAHYGNNAYGGYGAGYTSTIWEPGYDAATGTHWRGDPTRGGRISAFGGGESRSLDAFDPFNMALDKGLNYGNSFMNSMGEAAISGLVDGGRARLNFYFDKDGYFSGEGDALLPWYDSKHSTIYTQLGARSMHDSSDTRWIGNFGLGQRWFPFATGEDIKSGDYDAGNFMFGYNAFFDYDLTRDHQRGGFGIESQYDWLRLAANYYFPISDWKGSEDFDSHFVEERPAEGWDLRAKGYLPFYRNIAITGAYSQWYGDHVGMFGADELEKDPRVWSYGIEYTPVPLVSGFITQKSTERGVTDTEFGLNLTYHFGMPWDEQTSHAKVAELRTVGGARHEFVDRENRIILEYRAKSNLNIEYLGFLGGNRFLFRVVNGFGEFMPGVTVQVSGGGGVVTLAEAPAAPESLLVQAGEFLADLFSISTAHAAGSVTKVSNSVGEFELTVTAASFPATVTATVGNSSVSFTLNGSIVPVDIVLDSGFAPTLASGGNMPLTYKVTLKGTSDPAPDGIPIKLLAQTQGGMTTTAQKLEVASGTVLNGQVTLTFSGQSGSSLDGNAFLDRKVVLYAVSGSDESAASGVISVGTIPVGTGGSYLTGLSLSMTWSNARSYCASHGGTLPLVNRSPSQATSEVRGKIVTVGGIGSVDLVKYDTLWANTGLPDFGYWTGTEVTEWPGDSWFVRQFGGSVRLIEVGQGNVNALVCVP